MGTDTLFGEPKLNEILAGVAKAKATGEYEGKKAEAALILKNEELFEKLEKLFPESGFLAYISDSAEGSVHESDVPPLGSMLEAVGFRENIFLIIESPGGDATVAEKIVTMFWEYTNHFKVVVPNRAKSAATLMALGSEEILMGFCSELGPIDPQYPIKVGDVIQWVSSFSITSARDELIRKANEAQEKHEPLIGYLEQLHTSTMDPAFAEECKRHMGFAMDFAIKWLPKYMLSKTMPNANQDEKIRKAEEIGRDLLSEQKRFHHGRLINAEECKKEIGLNVNILKKEDEAWALFWEIYLRAKIFMMVNRSRDFKPNKVFITRKSFLLAG